MVADMAAERPELSTENYDQSGKCGALRSRGNMRFKINDLREVDRGWRRGDVRGKRCGLNAK